MGTLTRIPCICLLLCLLALPMQGLEIMDPEEVEYIRLRVRGVLGGSLTLECGSTLPTIFIWGFTQPGTQSNQALAYNYGQGPKLQPLTSSLGRVSVMPNTSSLRIEQLSWGAEGTYTCQALYDADEGAKITFYFTHVDVEEE
ncbi:V-set and immunoglobulin domain-containing protein 10-like 2 [Hypomesus transpacificus]|uniref:V-set and immunoglobulin domain-containing protein 10-like 2 n=1 Tax=Hypomesus transpacificus TaxID=137520 RepID=UPI001F078DAD|nr:V-set and immunoglobulin domain-containing protein 10-like 2 [Hypomesus transpacificus]